MSLNAQLLHGTSDKNTMEPKKGTITPNGTSWEQKVAAAVKHFNKFVHSKQIIQHLSDTYGYTIESLYNGNISTALNKLKNNGSLFKYQADQNNRNTFWGSPKWIDKDGNILPEFAYDEAFLFKPNAKMTIDI